MSTGATSVTGPTGTAREDGADRLPATLAAPARRALAGAGVTRVEDLTYLREDQLLALHGLGPKAVAQLRAVLCERGRSFAAAEPG